LFSISDDVGVDACCELTLLLLLLLILLLLFPNKLPGIECVSFFGVEEIDILGFSIVLIVPLRVLRSRENSLMSRVD